MLIGCVHGNTDESSHKGLVFFDLGERDHAAQRKGLAVEARICWSLAHPAADDPKPK